MVVHRLGVSQQRHLRTQRRSWGGINPRFHAANLKRPVVSRETEVVFQRRSVLTWGSAAPFLACPQTPAQRHEAEGKGRFQAPLPRSAHSTRIGRHWSVLMHAFTNAAGTIPTSVPDAMTSKLSHIMRRQTTLTSAG